MSGVCQRIRRQPLVYRVIRVFGLRHGKTIDADKNRICRRSLNLETDQNAALSTILLLEKLSGTRITGRFKQKKPCSRVLLAEDSQSHVELFGRQRILGLFQGWPAHRISKEIRLAIYRRRYGCDHRSPVRMIGFLIYRWPGRAGAIFSGGISE